MQMYVRGSDGEGEQYASAGASLGFCLLAGGRLRGQKSCYPAAPPHSIEATLARDLQSHSAAHEAADPHEHAVPERGAPYLC